MEPPIRTYRAFWPYYLSQHAKPRTRLIHIAGTLAAGALLAGVILGASLWFVVLALAAGYGPAWIAHFLVEKNRPATWRYPLWSLGCDLRMTGSWLAGNLQHELEKVGLSHLAGPGG